MARASHGFGAAALLAFGLGCAEPPAAGQSARLSRTEAPIINGTPDPTESGTVYVSHIDYPFLCSGTLIASTLVVTAKHCVIRERSGPDEPLAGDRFRVGFGPRTGALTYRATARLEWIGAPGTTEVQPAVDGGEDVALLWLTSAAPSNTKIHAVKLDYAPASSHKITIVGYGRSSLSGGGAGVKLSTVDDFNGWDGTTGILQTLGKGACSGDSGGSFFFGPARELIGVTSTAGGSSDTQFCDIGITNASSVRNAEVAQLLSDALASLGVCSPQAELCNNGQDEDCDGIADNSCRKDGEICASDVACENGVCRDLGAGKVCARPCDALTKCPSNQRCFTSCTQGWCEPGAQGQKKLFETCTNASECATNHCSAEGCSVVCNPNLGQCPDDTACAVAAGCGECADLAGVPGPRQLGETCQSTSDCDVDGECVDDGFSVKRCAMPCLEGNACSKGFACRIDRCVRTGGLSIGERCLSPEDCGSFLCATFADPSDNYCTKPCAVSADCGSAFDCLDELGSRICVSNAAPLGKPCQAASQCSSNQCHPTLGICTRKCDPETAPCPAGFRCEVVQGELSCVPGPNPYPDPAEPEPEGGAGTSSGGTSGTTGGTGTGGTSGASGSAGSAGSSGNATPGDGGGESSGCGCRAASQRPTGSLLGLLLAALAFLRLSAGARSTRSRTKTLAAREGASVNSECHGSRGAERQNTARP